MPTTNFINTHPGWSITYFFMIRARAATFTECSLWNESFVQGSCNLMWMDERHLLHLAAYNKMSYDVCVSARSRKGADCVHQGMTHIVLLSSLVLLFTAHEMPLCFELARSKKDNVPWKFTFCVCIQKNWSIVPEMKPHTHKYLVWYFARENCTRTPRYSPLIGGTRKSWSCIFSWNQMCSSGDESRQVIRTTVHLSRNNIQGRAAFRDWSFTILTKELASRLS